VSKDQSGVSGSVIDGYFSQLGLAKVLNDPASTWNPWAPGGVQPADVTTALDGAKYAGPTASGSFAATTVDAKVNGTITQLAAGPLAAAAGIAQRKENYEVTVPAVLGLGDIAGLGGATLPQSAARRVSSLFGELNAPFMKGLEGNASIRRDHYDDLLESASPTTGKLSLRWTPVSTLIVRGSAGTGFRAPSLNDLHQPKSIGTSEVFTDPLFADVGPQQVNAVIGGEPKLKPEKSKQYSLGVVFSPTKEITTRIDYWKIKIDDMIVAPSALALISRARAGGFLFRPGEVTFFSDGTVDTIDQRLSNAASADYQGVDLGARWSRNFDIGRLTVDYGSTYMLRARLQTLAGVENSIGTMVDADGNPLTLTGGGVVVRYKHSLAFNWLYKDWGATLTNYYYSGYRDGNSQEDGVTAHHVSGQSLFDGQVAYTGFKNIRLAVGARNLFDKNPPLSVPAANYFQAGYDPSMYDPRARFFYARATIKF
jgi:iron complex outermembrane receptor protein